ncbi:MAG: YggS family pyridoxal phosphate-dependent enzyme [Angustibacter sp.]
MAANLAQVRERIAAACRRAGRPVSSVTLIVVTKTFPVSDVIRLNDLGVEDVGENRDQEAASKAAALAGRRLRWHFIGQVQRNKARSVVRYADAVHSVDRISLVPALDRACAVQARRLDVALQVDLSDVHDPKRGGAAPAEVPALVGAVASSQHLDLRGVMAVAPRRTPPGHAFALLEQVAKEMQRDHPEARWLSAGMSGDLEDAIVFGATHLRVGAAVLGSRPSLQ